MFVSYVMKMLKVWWT